LLVCQFIVTTATIYSLRETGTISPLREKPKADVTGQQKANLSSLAGHALRGTSGARCNARSIYAYLFNTLSVKVNEPSLS
jgi:hypothetical protein